MKNSKCHFQRFLPNQVKLSSSQAIRTKFQGALKVNFRPSLQLKVRKTSIRSNLQKLKRLPQLTLLSIFCINKCYHINQRKSRSSSTFLRREERKPGLGLSDRQVSNPTLLKSLKGLRSRNSMSLSSLAMLLQSKKEPSKLTSLRRLSLR